MELIKENLTQDEIADKLGVSRFTIIRDIKFLKQNGSLSRVCSNKTGFWKIQWSLKKQHCIVYFVAF